MAENMDDVVWKSLPPVPKGVKPLDHQVAGHVFGRPNGQKQNQLGFLQNDEGQILKPIQGPIKGKREAEFYSRLFDSELAISELIELRTFVPKYFGQWVTEEHPGCTYLILENITHTLKIPCIMDIKIGPITYDKYADENKISSEKKKSPFLEKLGFQILGIKVFSTKIKDYIKLDRYFLRALDETAVLEKGLKVFFNLHEPFGFYLVKTFLEKLSDVQNWFYRQKKLYFIASSLLFVYDATVFELLNPESSSDMVMQAIRSNSNLKMIDFTHVFDFETEDGRDENYITGLNSLVKFMELVQKS
ncbi:hypothetical protein HELRODRAFT_158730 [Helobdella robusta]|uniref:Kinase n=1 Tax=Helobdella robusta TaxID=6412 RepID=T1EN59_HELRO|nr:hypothetical protein HELRODRAFT_158730 [Helobdella robusta]ESO12252.1 hypothetical protein HELRODRAFT_158730 [Helobdella robusta]